MIVSVMFFLTCRLCSKTIAKRTDSLVDKTVESVAAIASFGQALRDKWKESTTVNQKELEKKMDENEASMKEIKNAVKDKVAYLTRAATIQNIVASFVLLLMILIWDIVGYVKATKYSVYNWYLFFPLPVIMPVFFGVSFIIALTFAIAKCIFKFSGVSFAEIASITLFTSLSVFFLYHGFWFILMFGVFPDRIISKALFLIPLYFPLKLLLQYTSKYIERFKKLVSELKKEVAEKQQEEMPQDKNLSLTFEEDGKPQRVDVTKYIAMKLKYAWSLWKEEPSKASTHFFKQYILTETNVAAMVFIIFFWILWIPLLVALYFASDYLLIVTDIRKDPIKLIAFVIATSIIASRLAKIWKPLDDKEEEKNKKKYKARKGKAANETEDDSKRSQAKASPRKRPPPPPPKTMSEQLAEATHDDDDQHKIYESLSLSSTEATAGDYTLADAPNDNYEVASDTDDNNYALATASTLNDED